MAIRNAHKFVLAAGLNGLEECLKDLPVETMGVQTGRNALKVIRLNGPAVCLVSALNLPDMPDGKLIQLLRDAYPWMRCIAIIQNEDGNEERCARQAGACTVFPASVSGTTLLETVMRLLQVQPISRRKEPVLSAVESMDLM